MIQIKNRLNGKVIMEIADLSGANLCKADLRGANLLNAILRDANLREAALDIKIYQATRTGSSGRMTTYDATNNIVWCGCFKGSMQQFEAAILKTHENNDVDRNNYLALVAYFKALK